MELHSLTIHELHKLIKNKDISCLDAASVSISRIEAVENKVDSFISLFCEKALAKARILDEKIASGMPVSALTGVPMGLKDNICTKDDLTTCGSQMLSDFVSPYSATAYQKLSNCGAVLMGKLNMDEFAMGSSTENSAFKKTKNPYDLSKVPGGSSGGCAASVAADEVFFALGSDTGGSVRQPAAFCGCVGLKPTYGTISRYGLISYASSLDQIGPITKDVRDAAIVLDAIKGYDKMDSTSSEFSHPDFEECLTENIKNMKIGIPENCTTTDITSDVAASVNAAIKNLKTLGAIVDDVSIPSNKYSLPAYYIISSAEASSNLARFDGIKYGYRPNMYENLDELYTSVRSEAFGDEVKRRIMLGTYVLSTDKRYIFEKAKQVRSVIINDFKKAFEKYDVLVTPAYPSTAFHFCENRNPIDMYASGNFTVSVNICGFPAIVIPCGYDKSGLPIGIQIIGNHFEEATILKVAYALEKTITKQKPTFKEQFC